MQDELATQENWMVNVVDVTNGTIGCNCECSVHLQLLELEEKSDLGETTYPMAWKLGMSSISLEQVA